MTQGDRHQVDETSRVRNVVLVGPGGSGKTMLMESLLFATGAINRLGSIAEGSTVGDHEDVEHRLGRSISLAVASVEVSDPEVTGGRPMRLNLIDTPGHADFVGELRAGLRGADAALFVISAVDGVDGSTRMLWHECAAVSMPRAVVITHFDQPRGDFATVLANCQAAFGEGVQPLYLPAAGGDLPDALIGLLSGTLFDVSSGSRVARPAEPADISATAGQRDALIEAVITESEDDSLLDRYLAGEQVSFETLVDDLETAVSHGSFHPVLPCLPTTGLGVTEVLEVICRCFPAPNGQVLPTVYTPQGMPKEAITGSPDGPLVAEVIKTTTDPYVGRVSLVRLYSGTLRPESPIHVSGHFARFTGKSSDEDWHGEHDIDERGGAMSRPLGGTLTPMPTAQAGDIVAIAKLGHAETGDTLSDPADTAVLAPWVMPDPLLPTAIAARASSEEDKLMQALGRLQAEDPTVRVTVDPATEQMVMWTMGEQQLEVLLDRLRARGGTEVATSAVRVAMRETLRGKAAGTGRHVKQSGGHGQYAIAQIEVEPLAEGAGFEFVDKVVGGAVPRQFIPSVEKGVRTQLDKGVTGYPMVDVRVTLVGGKAHTVDSSDAAFQLAGALALKEAAAAAGIQLLEPLDAVEITVDDDYVGAVLADLASRRGRVRGTEPAEPGRSTVQAEVPAIELSRYAPELRSLAHGTGVFARMYLRHAPAPQLVADRLAATEK